MEGYATDEMEEMDEMDKPSVAPAQAGARAVVRSRKPLNFPDSSIPSNRPL